MSSSDAWHVKFSECRPLSEERKEEEEKKGNSSKTDLKRFLRVRG